MLVTCLALWRRGRTAVTKEGVCFLNDEGHETLEDSSAARGPALRIAVIEQLLTQPPPLFIPGIPPGPVDNAGWAFVSTLEQLRDLASVLSQQHRFALDVEHHSVHSYTGVTCLLQISTGSEDYIIDALALSGSMQLLSPVFSDPKICKVLHGGGNDVTWLQRDFGLTLVNVFDTEKACQVLGYRQRSLAWLLRELCGVDSDKSLQQADWRQRPLSKELLLYARTDVHFLLYIADCLGQRLMQRDAQLLAQWQQAEQDEQAQQAQQEEKAEQEQQEEEAGQAQQAQQEQQAQHSAGQQCDAEGQAGQRGQPASKQLEVQQQGQEPELAGSQAGLSRTSGPPGIVHPTSTPLATNPATPLPPHLTPGSKLWAAVQRSQALCLVEYKAPAPRAAAELAALAVMKRHVSELQQVGQLARREAVPEGEGGAAGEEGLLEGLPGLNAEERREFEAVGDCVFALCQWRDGVARALDDGLQCVLPDPVLLALARAPPLTRPQLLQAIEPFQGTFPTACCFPRALLEGWPAVEGLLREAAGGQHPWVSTELSALVQPGGGLEKAARKKRTDPAAFRDKLAKRFSAKKAVYENCVMLSREGEVLCHTDRQKLQWYLRKGIATKVSDDPFTVQLCFQHNTTDQARGTNEYYQALKKNKCVGCGEEGHYLRYRVVPSCYRRAMPVHLKSHRSHDVVLLCVSCHEVAHGAAEKLKKRIAEETGIPLFPPLTNTISPGAAAAAPTQGGSTAAAAAAAAAAGPAVGDNTAAAAAAVGPSVSQADGGAKDDSTTHSQAAAAAIEEVPHPYRTRHAALALDSYAASMPEQRRRDLEGVVLRFLGHPSDKPQPPLSQGELLRGLLAGLSLRSRRKTLRRWLANGRELPEDLAGEARAAGAGAAAGAADGAALAGAGSGEGEGEGSEGGGEREGTARVGSGAKEQSVAPATAAAGSIEARNGAGHQWHGQQVVEGITAASGDEGLLRLCTRFRQTFVDALRPQYLPPGWQVEHAAVRDFGEHSIYNPAHPRGGR